MEKSVILSFLLAIETSCCATPSVNVHESYYSVHEIYYAVNKDTVDRKCIIENRFLSYDKDWKFLSGYKIDEGQQDSLSSDASGYYRTPSVSSGAYPVERDSSNRIVHYENEQTLHSCKYDQWSNLTEDKSVDANDSSEIVEVLTYEYVYLTNFNYHTKKNGKLEIKSVDTSPWVARTIRKNGRIVEFTERKIQH